MHPLILIGGAAAAWFLTACSKNKDAEAKPPANPSSETEGLPLSPEFSQDPLAKESYQRLKKLGIKDSDLNRGCPTIKYFEDGKTQRIVENPGDKILFPCEVYEYALDHYETYPEVAESIAGRPLPWSLDARDPATSFDEAIRAKVKKAIDLLDSLLKKGGFQPGSEEYQEGRAIGLFYFSMVPKQETLHIAEKEKREFEAKPNKTEEEFEKLKNHLKNFAELQESLKKIGGLMEKFQLLEFKAHHEKGLGFYLEMGDYSQELSALQTLSKGKGECTEMSKVLFAVLKLAGFSPSFVHVDPTKSGNPTLKRYALNYPGSFHICLQIKIGNRVLLLDPAMFQIDPSHYEGIPLTLREYLANDYLNQGKIKEKEHETALEFYQKALRFYPNFPSAYFNQGSIWEDLASSQEKLDEKKASWKKSLEFFTLAIQANPAHGLNYTARGMQYLRLEEPVKALADFNQALAKDPDLADAYFKRGMWYFHNGNSQKGTDDFISCAQKSFGCSDKIYRFLLNSMDTNTNHPQLEQIKRIRSILREELNQNPAELQAKLMTAGVLWKAGQDQRERTWRRMKEIFKIIEARQKELKKEHRVFSEETVEFLVGSLNSLPPSMQEDPEFQMQRKKLSLPEKP